MALWHLIVSGIESRVRGMLSYLASRGLDLLSPATATEAAQRTIVNMSMTDPEDISLTHQVATEQQQVIATADRIMKGQIVGNLTELPTVSTFPPNAPDNVRYHVIVEVTDPVTGNTDTHYVEKYSDFPILRDDVLRMAENDALNRNTPLSPPTSIAPDAPVQVTRSVIIGASKRM